jgi:DHA3 family macrolide efflux protein-like MFS transporter
VIGPFRLLLASRAASALAGGLFNVVALWVVSRYGPAAVAWLGLAMTLPRLLSFVAGSLVDRADRRRLLVVAEGGRAAVALGLAALLRGGVGGPGALVAAETLMAAGSSLFGPLVNAWTPELVDPARLTEANGQVQGVWQAASLLGYLVGGAALALGGAVPGFVLAAGLLTAALGCAWAVPDARRLGSRVERGEPLGSRVMWAHPVLRFLVPGSLVFNMFFAPLTVGLVLLARSWHWGPTGYVALEGAWAAGNLLGGFAASRWRPVDGSRALMLYGWLGGIPLVLSGVAGWPPGAVLGLLVAGGGNLLLNASALTAVQNMVPAEIRGRVMGVLFGAVGVAMPLGIALWGVVSSRIPDTMVLLVPGAGSCLVAGLAIWPPFRQTWDALAVRRSGTQVPAGGPNAS